MKTSKHFLGGGLLIGLLAAGHASAAATAQELARLGNGLTPIGAEQAASADGRIPAWQGGLPVDAGQVQANGQVSDPYAGEKPLFVISAANYPQYQEHLTPGQIALLKRYPDYRLPVYPSHRSVALPDYVKQAALHNAGATRLVDGGNGLEDFQGAVAFPVPHDGLEAIWNHVTRYRGKSLSVTTDSVAPQANGDYTVTSTDRRFTLRDQVSDYRPGQNDHVLFYYFQKITAPAREAGEVLLVHETIDQVKEPRQTWIYNAGQRRVRRAPDVAYDAVGPGTSGLRTADNLDMYNGAPDRYDWKLVGKKEVYIPYNSYPLTSPTLKYKDLVQAGHLNQDHTRYELHRVWEVVATLKPGARHVYAKRHFFIDEDSWAIAEVDQYDNRGELWRVGEAHAYFRYDAKVPLNAAEVFHDLQSGRYIASGLINEERKGYDFSYRASSSDYTPGALRSEGVR